MDRWLDASRMPCEKCEQLHIKWGKEPDCKSCMPELMDINQSAKTVFLVCQDQVIMSFSGVVGLNQMAIENAMERCHVQPGQRDRVFFQVVTLGRHFCRKMRESGNGS